MERAAWTAERLDDLLESVRTGFTRGDEEIRSLRSETGTGFDGLRGELRDEFAAVRGEARDEFAAVRGEARDEFAAVRVEMRDGFAAVRGEINELRRIMLGVGGGIILALIGVFAAILARGV